MKIIKFFLKNKIKTPFTSHSKFNFSKQKDKENVSQDLYEFLPFNINYTVPKYAKNPKDLNFPLLINGAPKLDIKVT